jgi:hypothetical protein
VLPRIISVESIKTDYQVITSWNTGERRPINFKPILLKYAEKPNSSLGQLLKPSIFESVQYDPEMQSLFWNGLIQLREKDGSLSPAPPDFCPDVLLENSTVLP